MILLKSLVHINLQVCDDAMFVTHLVLPYLEEMLKRTERASIIPDSNSQETIKPDKYVKYLCIVINSRY